VKDGNDREAIKKAADELTQVSQKVGAELYKEGAAGAAGATQATGGSSDEKVVDAEFKEKDGDGDQK